MTRAVANAVGIVGRARHETVLAKPIEKQLLVLLVGAARAIREQNSARGVRGVLQRRKQHRKQCRLVHAIRGNDEIKRAAQVLDRVAPRVGERLDARHIGRQ